MFLLMSVLNNLVSDQLAEEQIQLFKFFFFYLKHHIMLSGSFWEFSISFCVVFKGDANETITLCPVPAFSLFE